MSWVDDINQTPLGQRVDAPEPPPKTGRGSSTEAWAAYAEALGYTVADGAGRSDIISMIEAGPPRGPNRAALEEQIEAMATGREHRALVESCRQLADQVDRSIARGGFSDKAWREYRLSLRALREAVADGGDGDPIHSWIDQSRGKVRDTEDAGT